jgi:hypothetical protein
MHTRSPERPKRSKQTNQPAPYPAEATNQAATYRFPSEQISPCTPKNFYLFIDSVHINAKNHHIFSARGAATCGDNVQETRPMVCL